MTEPASGDGERKLTARDDLYYVGLQARAHTVLARAGYKNFAEIYAAGAATILSLPSCGRKTGRDIYGMLAGLKDGWGCALFSMDDHGWPLLRDSDGRGECEASAPGDSER